MLCQACKKHPAQVRQYDLHYDQPGEPRLELTSLCVLCAKQRGLPLPGSVPKLTNVVSLLSKAFLDLQGAVAGDQPRPASEAAAGPTCPDCGWSLRDFRQTSRFGCPKDYEVFSTFVEEVLERIHGTSEHPAHPEQAELARLRAEMAEAVEREDYEAAAGLRDRIHDLEKRLEDAEELEF